MPKYICKCSNVICLSSIPNSNELLLIEDEKFEKYFENFDPIDLYQEMILTLLCDQCHRLYIFEKSYDKKPIIYQKEEGDWD